MKKSECLPLIVSTFFYVINPSNVKIMRKTVNKPTFKNGVCEGDQCPLVHFYYGLNFKLIISLTIHLFYQFDVYIL